MQKNKPAPALVRGFLEREEQFGDEDDCRRFLLAKIAQGEASGMAITAGYIEYMMGCKPNEARALLRWVAHSRKD